MCVGECSTLPERTFVESKPLARKLATENVKVINDMDYIAVPMECRNRKSINSS